MTWRALALLLLVACGPVATSTEPTPAETLARRAVAAALRLALIEACRATMPAADSHPAHRIAWGVACTPILLPATAAPPPPPSPAPPSHTVTEGP